MPKCGNNNNVVAELIYFIDPATRFDNNTYIGTVNGNAGKAVRKSADVTTVLVLRM